MSAARWKDLCLGLLAASMVLAAASLSPAGDRLVLPSGETLPAMCWVREATGVECPTCGMSRSFVAFFHGDLPHAFLWHPIGPLFAVGAVLILALVVGFALTGRKPLSGRPRFVRAFSGFAVAALAVGLARALFRALL